MRYWAQRARTREWITRDLPLADTERTRSLNGPGSIAGVVEPEVLRYRDGQGRRLLEEWATIVYAVNDSGDIVNHGIVAPPTAFEDRTRVMCVGIAAFPQGRIYTDSRLFGPAARVPAKKNDKGKVIRKAKPAIPRPDPIEIYRHLWWWLQQQQRSNLNVRVIGDLSTRRDGKGEPRAPIGTNAEPYRLRFFEAPDIGAAMSDLQARTPFEFAEHARWTDDRQSDVQLLIEVGYPSLGTARNDMRFAEDENVPQPPTIGTPERRFNRVIAIGKGEGPRLAYKEHAWEDGRLGRDLVLTDKTSQERGLLVKAKQFQAMQEQDIDLTSLVVVQHANADINDIKMGDRVRVIADNDEYGEVDLWVKVLSSQQGESEHTATLTTANAAFFRYDLDEQVT